MSPSPPFVRRLVGAVSDYEWIVTGHVAKLVEPDRSSLAAVMRAHEELFARPDLDPPIGVLLDSRYTRWIPSVSDLRKGSEFLDGLRRPGLACWALVVDKPVLYGLGRVLQAYLEFRGLPARIFRSEEPAERWLRDCLRECA